MFDSTFSTVIADHHVPEYDHTQSSNLYLLLLVPAAGLMLAAHFSDTDADALGATLAGVVLGVVAYSFRFLRVVDEGDCLALCYGPLPMFRKRFRYDDMLAAKRGQSSLVDGWGIHWVPYRGWTYNLWGFDCVRLTLRSNRTVRIGTDDPIGLADFLERRISQA